MMIGNCVCNDTGSARCQPYAHMIKQAPQECVLANLCCTGCSGHRLLKRLLPVPDLASMGSRLRLQQCTQASCLHPHCCAGALPQEMWAPVAGRWACHSNAAAPQSNHAYWLASAAVPSVKALQLKHCQ